MKRNKPRVSRKGSRAANRLAVLVLLVCVSTAAVLCYLAWQELGERSQSNGYYQELSGALHRETAAPTQTPTEAPEQSAAPDESAAPTEAPASSQPAPSDTPAPAGSAIDFDLLRQTCPDVVGWIAIEGTQIDYPVVQGTDNIYYLNHLPDGERNAAGSIMLDAACYGVFGNEINILHGHHMKNRSMFGGLDFYREEAYYLEHPAIRLFTPDGDREAVIFAAFTVDGEAFGYPTAFASDAAFEAFLKQAREKSAFQADVQVTRGDRLLVLSTCAYSYETERLLVVAKIIE